jgi:hypothetical protein
MHHLGHTSISAYAYTAVDADVMGDEKRAEEMVTDLGHT